MKKNNPFLKFFSTFMQSIWTILKGFLLVGLLGGIAAMMVGGFIILKTIETAPPLDISKIYATESSYIYDKDGNVIAELGVQKREWVSYSDISPVLIDAIVATEDSRFYEHHGVDWQRFLVAFIVNLKSGDFDQGASTITQQLVKQSHLTNEKSIERKLKEIYLSIQIEKVLTKEQIIEGYLNFSPFGGSLNGIQKAAEYYFGKSASDLNLSEAATLAGIVQRPNVLRPDTNPENSEERRNTVLKLMVKHGYITDDMATLAAAKPITDMLVYKTTGVDDRTKYQSFIDVVIEEIQTKYGLDPYSGLQIYTTMDKVAQDTLYAVQNEGKVNIPENMQTGIVFMETKSGKIRAIGGGSNQEGERTFNFATQIKRQPGSTAKPIFAYGPAIEYLGWGSGTNETDELYTYVSNKNQVVHNYNLIYQGTMTIRSALDQSLNVPAVKAFNAVGADKVQEFASNLGLPVPETLYESSAIGGVETGFSPLQMAGAYATFGNEGVYNEPITVEKIVQSDGTTIYADQKSEKVMTEETAYIMTDMLHSVMTDGTGRSANVTGLYLSGKTGTTNFPTEIREKFNMPYGAIRDSWFVGYSSEYTTSVWSGYPDSSEGEYINNSTQSTPWKVFNYVMKNLNSLEYVEPQRPSTVIEVTIEKESEPTALPSALTPDAYKTRELFIKGTEPKEASTRFQKLPTPQNVNGSFNGSQLQMNWDHITTYTVSSEEIDYMLGIHKSNQQKDSLGSYSPVDIPEHKLRMMRNQLNTIGATVYKVYARDIYGNEIELGTTQSNSFTKDISVYDMINYAEFYVRATYESYGSLMSDNSNVFKINNIESFITFVTIPNMTGWTKDQVNRWGQDNKINITFNEVINTTVPAGTVISTSPGANEKVEENKTLTVTIASSQMLVPDYTKDQDFVAKYQAWGTLNNIVVNVVEKNDPTIKKGDLISINPGANGTIAPGSTLTITISKGPADEDVETGGDGGNTGNGGNGGDGGNTGDGGDTLPPGTLLSNSLTSSFRNIYQRFVK